MKKQTILSLVCIMFIIIQNISISLAYSDLSYSVKTNDESFQIGSTNTNLSLGKNEYGVNYYKDSEIKEIEELKLNQFASSGKDSNLESKISQYIVKNDEKLNGTEYIPNDMHSVKSIISYNGTIDFDNETSIPEYISYQNCIPAIKDYNNYHNVLLLDDISGIPQLDIPILNKEYISLSYRLSVSNANFVKTIDAIAYIFFNDDGKIYVKNGSISTYLMDYSINTWYFIEITKTNTSFSVSINDNDFDNIYKYSQTNYDRIRISASSTNVDKIAIDSISFVEISETNFYNGLVNFNSQEIGSEPSELTISNDLTSAITNIKEHDNVYEITSCITSDLRLATYDFSNNEETYGNVEVWIYTNQSSKTIGFSIMGNQRMFLIIFNSAGKLQYTDASGTFWVQTETYITNSWYHFRFEYNLSTQKINIYKNQSLWLSNYNFYDSAVNPDVSYINKIEIRNQASGIYSFAVDSLDLSIDENYYVGRNLGKFVNEMSYNESIWNQTFSNDQYYDIVDETLILKDTYSNSVKHEIDSDLYYANISFKCVFSGYTNTSNELFTTKFTMYIQNLFSIVFFASNRIGVGNFFSIIDGGNNKFSYSNDWSSNDEFNIIIYFYQQKSFIRVITPDDSFSFSAGLPNPIVDSLNLITNNFNTTYGMQNVELGYRFLTDFQETKEMFLVNSEISLVENTITLKHGYNISYEENFIRIDTLNNSQIALSEFVEKSDNLYVSITIEFTRFNNRIRSRVLIYASNYTIRDKSNVKLFESNYVLEANSKFVDNSDYVLSKNSFLFSYWNYSVIASRFLKSMVKCYAFSTIEELFSDYYILSFDFDQQPPEIPEFDENDELDLPFWEYNSYKLTNSVNTSITFSETYNTVDKTTNETIINEFTYEYIYTYQSVERVTNKFYYNPNSIEASSWGEWGVNNWMRNLFVMLLNALIFLFQGILFLIIVAFQFLLVQLILWVIVLLWNYPLYWVIYGFIGILFYIIFAFVWIWYKISAVVSWLWEQIVWLWDNLIYPFLLWLWQDIILPIWTWILDNIIYPIWEYLKEAWSDFSNWFMNEGMFLLFNAMIIVISFIISLILFVLSFGTLDWDTTYLSVKEFIVVMNSFFVEFIKIFVNDGLVLLTYSALYLVLFGLGYMKYIFAKSKGNIARSEKIQSQLNVFKIPIVVSLRIMQYLLSFVQGNPNEK